MVVVPWSLEPVGHSKDLAVRTVDDSEAIAPTGTAACVISVRSPLVYVTFDETDPREFGIPLDSGEHQFPIARGKKLRFARAATETGEVHVRILWLKLRDQPETLA